MVTRQNIDKRRFAGAIAADKCMNLTGIKTDAGIHKCINSAEALADVMDFQHGRSVGLHTIMYLPFPCDVAWIIASVLLKCKGFGL